jgi:hypothetical protein
MNAAKRPTPTQRTTCAEAGEQAEQATERQQQASNTQFHGPISFGVKGLVTC